MLPFRCILSFLIMGTLKLPDKVAAIQLLFELKMLINQSQVIDRLYTISFILLYLAIMQLLDPALLKSIQDSMSFRFRQITSQKNCGSIIILLPLLYSFKCCNDVLLAVQFLSYEFSLYQSITTMHLITRL